MKPEALLWDLDGTLVDSEPVHAVAFSSALTELDLKLADDFHDRTLGVNEVKVHEMLVAETGTDLTLETWRAVKWAHYQRHAKGIRRRAGVAEVALDWAGRGVPSAIVSNSTTQEVEIAVSAAGLGEALVTRISFGDVSRGKPDPEGYLLAARKLGVAPEACLVIEDSPVGSAAGLAAGMRVIFHPQVPADPAAAPGAIYLPPDRTLADLVSQAIATGCLP